MVKYARIETILTVSMCVVFFVMFLTLTSIVTHGFIKQAGMKEDLMFEIQKRNVTIEALIISCELDYLIKTRRPDEIKTAVREGNHAID